MRVTAYDSIPPRGYEARCRGSRHIDRLTVAEFAPTENGPLLLHADLRLYATVGWVDGPPGV